VALINSRIASLVPKLRNCFFRTVTQFRNSALSYFSDMSYTSISVILLYNLYTVAADARWKVFFASKRFDDQLIKNIRGM